MSGYPNSAGRRLSAAEKCKQAPSSMGHVPVEDGGWHLVPPKAPRSAPLLGTPQQLSRAAGATAEDAAVKNHGKKGEGCPSLHELLQPQSQDFDSTQARQIPTAAVAWKQPDPEEAPSTLASHRHQRRRFPLHALTCHGASPPADLSLRFPPVPLISNCSFYSQVPRREHARICLVKARLTYPGGEKKKKAGSRLESTAGLAPSHAARR